MKIDRVRIKGYRSLKDVEFRPKAFSVLVGPNNAGKSNVVEAFDFLAEAYGRGIKSALGRRDGFRGVAWRRGEESGSAFSFEVVVSLSAEERSDRYTRRGNGDGGQSVHPGKDAAPRFVVRHSFSLTGERRGVATDFVVETEELEVCEPRGSECVPVLHGHRGSDPSVFEVELAPGVPDGRIDSLLVMPDVLREKNLWMHRVPTRPDDLALESFRYFSPVVDLYLNEMADVRVLAIDPTRARAPGSSSVAGELGREGTNLPTVLNYLETEDPLSWDGVLRAMREVVPELDHIDVDIGYDGRLVLRFAERGIPRPWASPDVSDGTIRSLGLFAALYDPRHPLALIEEPENSLHPWAIRVFVAACREVAERVAGKQVIVTTHSPVVIDYARPEEVFLVWREDGRTTLSPLTERDPKIVTLWSEGSSTVSGLLDSGWLREAVPGGIR